ncbi:MAG TPA: hypothetical protein VEN29_03230 [Casimicrobiaceae bacterium]|nr:hypothetical protein [Casimicrobiaceae bacterium]
MEQIGEKQDFEAELSRLGFRHEDFALYVRGANFRGSSRAWTSHYAVRVTNTAVGKRNIYWGGPGEDWVGQFAADARNGLYGDLPRRRAEVLPAGKQRLPFRVLSK